MVSLASAFADSGVLRKLKRKPMSIRKFPQSIKSAEGCLVPSTRLRAVVYLRRVQTGAHWLGP
ncbi:MAG: hypothetical protein NVS3B20_08180 [Polyangiales bacterium]